MCPTGVQPSGIPVGPGSSLVESTKPTFIEISLRPHGHRPALPGFTTDHHILVVPNEASDNVSLVSIESLEVVGVVQLEPGSAPWQAKAVPDSALAYVTNSRFSGTASASTRHQSTVSVLDIDAGSVVDEIPVGAGPNGVTIDQEARRAYVANMRSNTVTVIDVASHMVLNTIPVGQAPAFVKLSRDKRGRLLLVTNLADSSATIVDTDRLEPIKTLQLGIPHIEEPFAEWGPGDTTGVAVTDDDVAYFTNYRSHGIVRVNLKDYSLSRLLCPLKFPFFVEIDRRQSLGLFSSGVDKKFALLDLATDDWLGVYANDGTAVLPRNADRMNIWMTDPDNDRITALLPQGIASIKANWESNIVTKFL